MRLTGVGSTSGDQPQHPLRWFHGRASLDRPARKSRDRLGVNGGRSGDGGGASAFTTASGGRTPAPIAIGSSPTRLLSLFLLR